MATYFFNLLNNSQPENQPSPAETVSETKTVGREPKLLPKPE